MATLADIRTKVRRLTRSPSNSQLTDTQIDDYVNNFWTYDFPEQLRLTSFYRTLSFYTTPYVDVYDTNIINLTSPLYNFKNAIITTHDPVYIAGYKAYFTQSRNDFYTIYPALQAATRIGTGDGFTTFYTGTLTGIPLLQNNVMFTTIDANKYGVVLKDIPRIDPALGVPTMIGDLVLPDELFSRGTINYATGAYTITIPYVPGAGEAIYAQTVQYNASRPQCMLYFDQKFYLRPVPDMAYQVNIETQIRPTALVNAGDVPDLEEQWQFIALGAARKILIDRLDMETIALIEPEYKHQELLVLRRSIVQQSNERVATIFTMQTSLGASGWNWDNFG